MSTYCIIGNLKPECVEDYKEKHKTLHLGEYKKLLEIIKKSGIKEEKIFIKDSMIIIIFEADNLNKSYEIQGKSEILAKWNEVMKPMFAEAYDFNKENYKLPVLEKIFDLNEQLNGEIKG